jgi:pimeloyl-ACP methyl ester carboxylesterase
MPRTYANGIDIEYEIFGAPDARPLLLIMGLGAQMIIWDDDFCEQLAARGHRVIRFDNRDIGLSTKLDAAGMPNLVAAVGRRLLGKPVGAPYTLSDMAADTAGLLDALGIETADIVGASMGGMIAQTMAIEHPSRVRTLTSIMSTTGEPDLPQPTPEATAALLTPVPTDRAGNVERAVRVARVIGSPGFPFDEAYVRRRAARAYDRGFYPAGTARQLLAIIASGSRKAALEAVRVPALVIHGSDDPLAPLAGGIDTAEAIPGAELLILEGMGHDLPQPLWPRIIDAICALAARG